MLEHKSLIGEKCIRELCEGEQKGLSEAIALPWASGEATEMLEVEVGWVT